jgi:fimbrial chaperone protein
MRRSVLLLAALTAALAPLAARANSLQVSPVLFELPPGRNTATLSLQNQGDQPMTVQMRVFRWRNGDSGDQLDPASDLAASPPFAQIAPGGSQTVRLVHMSGAPITGEDAYRILVDELPPPDAAQGRTVTLLVRHSIPIFLEGPGATRPAVAWSARLDSGAYRLKAVNTGGRRLRASNVRLYDAQGRVLAYQSGLMGYVLGGSSVDWKVPADPNAQAAPPVRLGLDTDQGPLNVALAPPKP